MPASSSVAKSAMEAPTGPDGVRPFDCADTDAGIADAQHKTNNNHTPARCMGAIIPKAKGAHQLAIIIPSLMSNGIIFPVLDSVFVESLSGRFL
jgi:hypothetical protein